MLRALDERELKAIIAHEIVHLSQHDLSFFRLVATLQVLTVAVSRTGWILLIFFWPIALSSGVQIPLGAVALTKDAEGLARALEKIDQHQQSLWRQVIPVPQRRQNDRSVLRTHPAQEERIGRLRAL